MARVKVEINEDFFKDLGNSPGVQAIIYQKTKAVEAEAVAIAPYDKGDYQRSIKARFEQTPYRYVGVVEATDWKSALVECKMHVLRKALRRVKGS